MAEYLTSKVEILAPYLRLPQGDKIQLEYVWIDGDYGMRCKTMTVTGKVTDISQCKSWNFDGSSTNQAPGVKSDITLKPVALYNDPFRPGADNKLVLCETYDPNGEANKTNHRSAAVKVFEKAKEHDIWFGLEQEYTLFGADNRPFAWPKGGFPGPQGPYYCGVGAGRAFARDLVEAHYRACIFAGIEISGVNAEVMPSQWEFQVGPCPGIKMGDDLCMARFLLYRCAEDFGITASLHPKPLTEGSWNGAGCHTNISTVGTRDPKTGEEAIKQAIAKLEKRHDAHIAVYGEHNELRLTGKFETGHINKFSHGVSDRGASIRIPRHVAEQGYGYIEDRRPASNIDPYQVTAIVTETICLDA